MTKLTIPLLLFTACAGEGINGGFGGAYPDARAMIRAAKARTVQMVPSDLRSRLERREQLLVIDVREPDEIEDDNQIPEAINIPRGLLELRIGDEEYWDILGMYLPSKADLIVLCSEKGRRGALATESLTRLGYTRVQNLRGGWMAWASGSDDWQEDEPKPKKEEGCD